MPSFLKRLLSAGLIVGVLVAIAAAWALGLFTAEPEEVSLAQAVEIETRDDVAPSSVVETTPSTVVAVTSATSADVATSEGVGAATTTSETTNAPMTTTAAETTTSALGPVTLAGTWEVVPGEATFVGYRARGQTGVGVGRSPGVTGTLVAEGDLITTVEIVADLTQLKSDSSLRDDHLGDDGLETRTYPSSTFRLVEPISVPGQPGEGEELSFAAIGDLTVRDVTNRETIDLQATLVGARLIVVGSLGVALDDYGAAIGGTDRATMEFSLVFTK